MSGRRMISLAALALCAATPACAQETEVTSPPPNMALLMDGAGRDPETGSGGIRLTGTSSFTLLEHGVWQQTAASPGDTAETALQARPPHVQLGPASSPRSAPSSFRRSTWLPWVFAAENRHGLPVGLLDALIWTESRYNPMALSNAGAVGLAQLMPGTARELGVANRYDPVASIDGGARYLRRMLDRFGSIHLAVAAYNAGPNAVARAKGIPLNGETPGYVRNVLARWGLL